MIMGNDFALLHVEHHLDLQYATLASFASDRQMHADLAQLGKLAASLSAS